MFKNIVVAVDGTPTARRGLEVAIGVARDGGATLHIVHVVDELVVAPMIDGSAMFAATQTDLMLKSLRSAGRKIVAVAKKTAGRDLTSVQAEMVDSRGQPVASVILGYATRVGADLIVLGTHGRRGVARLLLGSDAEQVLRDATVPVLLVRTPETASELARSARTGTQRRKPTVRSALVRA
jgi:nucleotide-binding universal stress UspA family protein